MAFIRSLATISVIALLSSTASAAGEGKAHEACKDDADTYCKGIQPGGGRIINCLTEHYKDISDDCHVILQKIEAHKNGRTEDTPPLPNTEPKR